MPRVFFLDEIPAAAGNNQGHNFIPGKQCKKGKLAKIYTDIFYVK